MAESVMQGPLAIGIMGSVIAMVVISVGILKARTVTKVAIPAESRHSRRRRT